MEYPKTIGEATTLLNNDTSRAFEQENRIKSGTSGEGALSLMNRMAGEGDLRATAEEIAIHRKHPELLEFADQIARADKFNKDMGSFETKKARLESQAQSMPYSRASINFSDPKFVNDMISSLALWGPEATLTKYGALAAGHMAGKGLNSLSDSRMGQWMKGPKVPYRTLHNNEDEKEQ